jgi:tetratricopeptide (TPR) repeat protein
MLHGALLQQRDGKFDEAAAEYRIALKLNQASERPLPGVTAECNVLLGLVANLQGRTEEAISDYNQALRAVPGYALAYKALGIIYFPRGDYAQAKGYFERAVALGPNDLESRFYLGTCYLKLGKPRQAAAQFHAARVADPTYLEAYEAEARSLEAAGDAAEAAQVRSLARKSALGQ